MTEQIRQIAGRLKELREIEGMSQENLAIKLNITTDKYREYESGAIDIPISILYEVASLFDVELTGILSGDEPKLKILSIVRAAKGLNVERRKDYRYQNLAYNFTGKKMEPMLVTLEYHDSSVPITLMSHPGQEFNYVLEGSIIIEINGKQYEIEAGDSVYFDSKYPHGTKVRAGESAKYLAVIL